MQVFFWYFHVGRLLKVPTQRAFSVLCIDQVDISASSSSSSVKASRENVSLSLRSSNPAHFVYIRSCFVLNKDKQKCVSFLQTPLHIGPRCQKRFSASATDEIQAMNQGECPTETSNSIPIIFFFFFFCHRRPPKRAAERISCISGRMLRRTSLRCHGDKVQGASLHFFIFFIFSVVYLQRKVAEVAVSLAVVQWREGRERNGRMD